MLEQLSSIKQRKDEVGHLLLRAADEFFFGVAEKAIAPQEQDTSQCKDDEYDTPQHQDDVQEKQAPKRRATAQKIRTEDGDPVKRRRMEESG